MSWTTSVRGWPGSGPSSSTVVASESASPVCVCVCAYSVLRLLPILLSRNQVGNIKVVNCPLSKKSTHT